MAELINANMIEDGGGQAIIDDKDRPDYVAGAKSAEEATGGEGAAGGETQKTAEEIQAETDAETARVAGLTDEQKIAEQDAKIAEDNKDKTPDEIKALQEAARDTRTPEEKKAALDAEAKVADDKKANDIKQNALNDLFKKYGVKSEAELAAKLNPQIESPEEKKQKAEVYDATLNKYAVENGVFTNEELSVLSSLKKMESSDLVYNQFKKDYQELYKDRVDDDKKPVPVTEDETRDKFNELYHVESDDMALKEVGKKNLELAAKSLIAPLEEKYNDVKAVFDDENYKTASLPAYTKFVNSALDEFIPKELTFGEGESAVKVLLNNTNRDALEQMFVKNHYFEDFLQNGGTAEQRAEFKREIEKELYYQNKDSIAKVVGDVREGIGLKKGSVGAKAPFEEPKGAAAHAVDENAFTKEELDAIKKGFGR